MANEDQLLAKLEAWLSTQPQAPAIFDVMATGDRELLAAFVLKGFRAAARQAVLDRVEGEGAAMFTPQLTDAAAPVIRVFEGLARAWSLDERERLVLLGLSQEADLEALRSASVDEIPIKIVERVAILLDTFKSINTLLPEPSRADAWIRAPNCASTFGGRSALDVMIGRGLEGLREVRAYLNAQIWAG